jgi:hypothetical protein
MAAVGILQFPKTTDNASPDLEPASPKPIRTGGAGLDCGRNPDPASTRSDRMASIRIRSLPASSNR